MSYVVPRMTNLFEQLGLDSSAAAIAQFIESHQLNADVLIHDAEFWTESQRQFILEKMKSDGEWTTVIDQLNEALHEDSVPSKF